MHMTKNPLINALVAALYISAVGTMMSFGDQIFGGHDTIFIPMAMLSLFVLSAALMGYIFLYQPLLLILNGKHTEAVNLFLKTVAVFAVITALFFTGQALLAG